MRSLLSLLASLLVIALVAPFSRATEEPRAVVEGTVDAVLEVLREPGLPVAERHRRIEVRDDKVIPTVPVGVEAGHASSQQFLLEVVAQRGRAYLFEITASVS